MIISHKYKFIFIKTQKTAGSSIELYLSRFCGKDDIIIPMTDEKDWKYAHNWKSFIFKNEIKVRVSNFYKKLGLKHSSRSSAAL